MSMMTARNLEDSKQRDDWIIVTAPNLEDWSKEQQDDWIHVVDGTMKGMNIAVDQDSNEVISFSTKYCRDVDRWKHGMPSLGEYSALRILDLDNCRYLTELHDSVGSLRMLRRLFVTKCDRLERLPSSLCCLENLQEVGEKNISGVNSHRDFAHITKCSFILFPSSGI